MTRPIRILFVEDVPTDMELGAAELQKADIACVTMRVDKEKELLSSLQTFHPELVICDYSLPQFNGKEAVQLIQKHDPNLPVIMFTATQNELVAVECMKAGAIDYILKDNITRLPFAVKEALQKKHLRETREKALKERQTYIKELEKLNSELTTARQASLNLLEDLSAEMETSESTRMDLAESEQKYRQLTELTPDGILVHVDGHIVYANPAAGRILGPMTSENMVGRRILDFVHPDFHTAVENRVKRILNQKEVVPVIEEKLVRDDGSVIIAEVTAIPFIFVGKDAVQVVFSDITTKKEAEEALNQKIDELQKFNDLTIDREFEMISLKKEINELLKQHGEPEKYKIVE